MRAPSLLLALAFLAACNGSDSKPDDSGSTDSGPSGNRAPSANAGSDQTVAADHVVTLSGAGSLDPDGDALTYMWSFDHVPEGSAITSREAPFSVNHAGDPITTFSPDVPGTYVVALTVRDPKGASSAPDYVIVTAGAPDTLPVANAGADQTVMVEKKVSLDGSSSYDREGRALTYAWTLVDKPEGSALTSVSGSTSATASLTPDVKGSYIVALVVNNGLASSNADTVSIVATADDASPVVSAGADQETPDCTSINLTCTGSDSDRDELQYYWDIQIKPDTSQVTATSSISDRTSATPTFYPDQAGTYVLSCAAFDGTTWSSPDTMRVVASERSYNSAPSVNAGRDQAVDAGNAKCEADGYRWDCTTCSDMTITLGSDAVVSDGDGDPVTYEWSVEDGSAVIADPGSLTTQVTLSDLAPEEPGAIEFEYRFQLRAVDCTGEVVTDRVTFTATCNAAELSARMGGKKSALPSAKSGK